MPYTGDSFFTLSPSGQAGLMLLSAALAVAMIALARRLPGPRPVRTLTALAAFAAFVWLSPQVYYTYYRAIIPGLPAQWVIQTLDPGETIRLLTFRDGTSLSAHGRGVLGWAMIAAALIRRPAHTQG